ncbi:carbon-nitrogen hydrolase family protein [Streptomyces europaeiscabiei]|uniref:carbon-nitrogen hydrolase family protein n=1 Tax=Streptomyces europaeiscabiei TaxID=146819 RepID=UPI002E29F79D|nr:carbon-nitrogen hydrolase family protein [Streptomyces europaeiscabiei]
MRRVLRLAVAQTTVTEDPTDPANLRGSGDEIRRLMREASGAGARLVQFPEGAITYPGKYVMSSGPPGTLAAADWSRVDWSVMRAEAQSVADLAGELGLWVVFGSVHPLTPPHRPHNSLYVVSDEGALAARYDKRYLSHTELSYLYTPGTDPLVFELDGIRFGTVLCIEANFPELFEQYEQMDVDCVLISVMVDDAARAALAPAYATLYNYWVSYSVPAQFSATAPATITAPGGRCLARCHADNRPGLAIADIDPDTQDTDIDIALRYARPWRRTARAGLYDNHVVIGDGRSDARTVI